MGTNDHIRSSTEELQLSVLTGTSIHPDMQEIRITRFFFENMLYWQYEVETNFYKRLF
jgi:hypothetical protein